MDKQDATAATEEYRAARAALHRLAVIELPDNAPELADLGAAIDTLAVVLEGWYMRLVATTAPVSPQPVRQIGAAMLTRQFASAETGAELAR